MARNSPVPSGSESFRNEALPQMDAVYRFAIRLTGDADRASDLTQDTFLRAFQNWDRYTPGTKAKSWLFTICRNLFLRHRERTQRHDEIIAAVADEDPRNISRESTVFLAVEGRDPEGAFWRDVVDEEVLRAIDDLPIEFRQAVVLSDLEDLSYAEIAAVLDVPIGTVKSRLFRGRRILQSQLYEYALSEGIIEAKSPATVGRETRERNQ